MTIRLRCVECQRKLKVPDAALGKKVQCPVCGARFIGRTEPSPPPVNETSLGQPRAEAAPVEAASSETPLIDALFADMASSTPELEDAVKPKEAAVPAAPRQEPAAPSPLNLELDEPPAEIDSAEMEPLEPEVIDEETVIEEAVEEEPPLLDAAEVSESMEAAADDVDPVEVVDDVGEEEVLTPTLMENNQEPAELDAEEAEITEEAEPEEAEEKQPKKKKKRGLLCGCLAGIALVMLLGCGGVGILGYRFYNGSIRDGAWETFGSPEGRCSVLMPGEPTRSVESPAPSIQLNKYSVAKPWARSEFVLLFYDTTPAVLQIATLDKLLNEEATNLANTLHGTVATKGAVTHGKLQGREARLNLPGGRTGIIRFFQAPHDGKIRVYELVAVGPNLQANSGSGGKFFNSFLIFDNPTVGPGGNPGGQPRPGVPPRPRPPKR